MPASRSPRRPAVAAASPSPIILGTSRNKMPDPTGKAGQIVDLLEQRLTLGYYAPGQMLSFSMLADEFRISRQPVSTAILHLRAAGYVEVIPQVGCRVLVPTVREIQDFFFISSKIESGVVALAAQRYEPGEEKELLAIQPPTDLTSLEAQHQRKAYVGYIDSYHNQIWKMARAPLLEGKIAGIRRLSNFFLWQGIPTLAPAAARQLNRERAAIARAIAARDAKLASDLSEKHILNKPRLAGLFTEAA